MWKIDLGYRTEFQSTFERLYQKKQDLQASRPLPNIALNKIRESLSIEWTYNSNSIEGNTLSLRETQLVLQEGIVGSSRVDLQACKLEYSIVSPK